MKLSSLNLLRTNHPSLIAYATLIFSALTLGSVSHAAAIDILRNVTTGQTIFQDDFESYTVTSSPLVKPSSANATGTWTGGTVFGGNGAAPEIGITNQAGSQDSVVSQEGSQYFQLSSVPPSGQPSAAQTWIGDGVSTTYTANDVIEANIAFYLASGSNEGFFYLYDRTTPGAADGGLLAAFRLIGDDPGNPFTDFSLVGFDSTGAPAQGGWQQQSIGFNGDEWNTMNVSHTIGTSDWSVSFNNGTAITVGGYQDASSLRVDSLSFNQTVDTNFYVDAVIPEPSSIVLMGIGMAMTMAMGYRRRKMAR